MDPALWTPVSHSVNDSPYSRTLQQLNDEARGKHETPEDDEESASSSETNSPDDSAVAAGPGYLSGSEGDEQEDSKQCAEPECPSPSAQKDTAIYQKQQAYLRGGASERARVQSDASSVRTASSSRKRPARTSLLETLFLPRTTAAKQAPGRRHTVDGRSDAASVVGSTQSIAPSVRSQKTSSTARKDKSKPKSTRLSIFASSPPTPTGKIECITCLADDIPIRRSAKLECNHRMCHSCLKRIFTLSTTDPQLMPPRCCTENVIPLRHVDRLFEDEFKRLWNRKFAEYTTKNRLYCPSKGCGQWIKPKYVERDRATGRQFGLCNKCSTKVCKKCGMRWHGSRECNNDEGTKRVIELGKEQGWQRCYNCRTMVQLAEGCNHMRCHCNAEFCMVCGSKWKTCDCPWFNLPPEILQVNDYLVPEGFARPGVVPPRPPPQRGFGDRRAMPPPPPFRDNVDIPLHPVAFPEMFRPDELPRPPRPRFRRAMTNPGATDSPRRDAQEAADEALARQMQEQEFDADVQMLHHLNLEGDDPVIQVRQRAAVRRARRRMYAVTGEDEVMEYDPATANPEPQDDDEESRGNEAMIAGLRGSGEGRVESWRRHI